MGVVFMAEQLEPVRRKVALKIIKPGMDTRQVIARFEAERQALSLMDHPNIAKVLDAGATASGRPFFVMELVKGQPITQYCDEKHLTPRQRLELLLPVCQAIQHAHQKGVIHRDIKPSNILVAEYDQRPVPKVIDFGVAKAINQPLTEKTMFTGFGQIVGTLEYMSPEQAKVNQLDIDTRSDIYSLGVLMYELLTGSTPFNKQRLRSAAWDEVLRIIREEEPPKPSTRLSESKDSLPSVSALRQTEPARLTKLVRGELDWIVMKALDKDRSRRYESANGLAADIQNYLNDEPVTAGPPSVVYRLRKFSRRHKGPLLFGALILLLLVTGTLATSLELVRALRAERMAVAERKRAESERDAKELARNEAAANAEHAETARRYTREALNTLTDEVVEQWMGRQPRLGTLEREFLRKVRRYYEEFARSQGESLQARCDRADGLARVAKIEYRLGDFSQASESFREAANRFRQLVGESADAANRLGQATCLGNLGVVQTTIGQTTEATDSFRASLGLLLQLVEEHPDVSLYREKLGNVQNGYGALLMRMGQFQAAESMFTDAARAFRQLVANAPQAPQYRSLLAGILNNLAVLLAKSDHKEQVGPLLREVSEIYRQLAEQSPDVPIHRSQLGLSLCNLGNVMSDAGQNADAEAAYREATSVLRKVVTDYPAVPGYRQELARALSNLGNMLRFPERMEEGERAHQDSVAILQQLIREFGPAPEFRNGLGTSLLNQASFYAEVARPRESESADRQAIAIYSELVQEFPEERDYAVQLASVLSGLGRRKNDAREFSEARAMLEQARSLLRQALDAQPPNPDRRAAMHENLRQLARSLMGLRDHAAATARIEELVQLGHNPAADSFNAARLFAQCIDQVLEDEQLAEPARRELIDRYAQRAIELLQSAVWSGFTRVDLLQDTTFDSIRDRPNFKLLVEQLSQPAGGC